MLTHKKLKAHALERPDVKAAYDGLEEEFSSLNDFLKAKAAAAGHKQNESSG